MCTIFSINKDNKMLLAKNHDNFIQNGMIFTNKRGMKKYSLTMPDEKGFSWGSVYGSITFSQCGKGMPVGGMNEKGLVVEQATLPGTLYQEKDERPEISCLEAIQYLLDTCSSVDESIKTFKKFRISRNSWTLHYFISDRSGNSVIIEFLDGNMVVYNESEMPVPIITNTQYSALLKDNNSYKNDYEKNSVKRFYKVKEKLKNCNEESVINCFSILDYTKRDDTVWSCVYDLLNLELLIKSIYSKEIAKIKMEKVDFSEKSESKLCDIENLRTNDVKFMKYSKEENRKNIEGFFRNQIIIDMMHLPSSDFIIEAYEQHINAIEEMNIN